MTAGRGGEVRAKERGEGGGREGDGKGGGREEGGRGREEGGRRQGREDVGGIDRGLLE